MSKWSDISNVFNSIVLIGATLSSIVGGLYFYDDLKNAVATKEFHHSDADVRQEAMLTAFEERLLPIQESANAAESNGLPPRIANLLKVRCANPSNFDMSLDELLATLMDRYEVLNNRPYREGECRDGVYYNALGVVVR